MNWKIGLLTVLYLPISSVFLIFLVYQFYTCLNLWILAFSAALSFFVAKRLSQLESPIKTAFLVLLLTIIFLALFLASLNSGRNVGHSASAMQSLSNIRSQAELVYNSDDYTYENVCSDERVTNLIEAAKLNAEEIERKSCLGVISKFFVNLKHGAVEPVHHICEASSSDYQVKLYIPVHDLYWCVDSTGSTKFPNPDYHDLKAEDYCE